jgi:hypothetical protein
VLFAAFAGRCLYAFRDRNPGYAVALEAGGGEAAALRVGFAREKITPDLSDSKRPVWLAGFDRGRAATKVHDDLWAVACVVDDGRTRLGVVVLDAIGFMHDDVLAVRRRLAPELRLDYAVVCSTHNHSAPDLLGLWGPGFIRTGVDPRYREQVIAAAASALSRAAVDLKPARVAFHEISIPPEGLVADTRRPEVFDPDLRVMHFTRPGDGATLGTVVGWANHPETPWRQNTEITSDFCGILREDLGKAVGGTHLFVNGAIGGLLSTTPDVTVRDPFLERDFKEPSHDKSRAVGRRLAARILPCLAAPETASTDRAPIRIRARTVEVRLENTLYQAACLLGLVDRGFVRWKTLRTEVAVIRFGDASIACIPGEIYPEIVNGGVERAPGGDFECDPVEVPPLRELMPGRVKFVFGLANDEIGYLIPRSQWDRRPPWLYGRDRPFYGEINSVGPEAARTIHAALRDLCGPGGP